MKKLNYIYLVFLLTINLSCVEKKNSEKDLTNNKLQNTLQTETLKFTSGIRAIFQDSKGNYWFGSIKEGVALYDGNSLKYFTINEGLADNQIHSIQEDKKGVIWFDTQTGISSYDGKKIKKHIPIKNENSPYMNLQIDNSFTQTKWMKAEDDLWFEAGTKEGVYRYDGKEMHYLEFPPHKVLNLYDNLFAVTGISKGKNNMIWFGTFASVFGFNGIDFTIINDETLGYDRKNNSLHIRSILEDSKGRLWLGNNGIGVLLKEGDSIINFSEKNNLINLDSFGKGDISPQGTMEHIFTIKEDTKGNIWFGDRDTGIWKYDGKSMKNYTKKMD